MCVRHRRNLSILIRYFFIFLFPTILSPSILSNSHSVWPSCSISNDRTSPVSSSYFWRWISWIFDPVGKATLYIKEEILRTIRTSVDIEPSLLLCSFGDFYPRPNLLNLSKTESPTSNCLSIHLESTYLFCTYWTSLMTDLTSSHLFFKSSMRSSIDITLLSGVPKISEILRGDIT